MPEVIGMAILTALSVPAATAGATIAGVSVASIVGTTALIGGSLAIKTLTASDDKARVAGQQYASKQSLPPRRRAYGRVKLSGPYMAWDSAAGRFYTGVYCVEGPIDAFEQIWLDENLSAFPSGGTFSDAGIAPWLNAVQIEAKLGTADQAASSLLSQLPYWTPAHRLRGGAYFVLRAAVPEEDRFAEVYPSGTYPAGRAVIRASRVRNVADPTQTSDPATWKWSRLVTPCVRDQLTHPTWGLQVPDGLIDDASFAASAVLDAQQVPTRSGLSVPRYALGGVFDLTEEPADVLQRMMEAGDKRLYLTPEGKVGISGGRYVAPDVTIGEDAILSVGSIEAGNGKRATFNRLVTSFSSELHDFQPVEGATWDNLDWQAEAGETLEQPFERMWVQEHNQLARLAKIHANRENPKFRIKNLTTNRRGLPALFEDVVTLDLPRYGINLPCEVERAVASADGATCTFDLVSSRAEAWEFDPATEEGEPPALPSPRTPPPSPPVPAGLTAAVERRGTGPATAVSIRLTCTEPTRTDQRLAGRYRLVGASTWTYMVRDTGGRASVISAALDDGAVYEVQGALVAYGGALRSAWAPDPPITLTATADPVAPAAPVFISTTRAAGANTVNHSGRMPNSANARSMRLTRARGYGKTVADSTIVDTQAGAPNATLALSDVIDLGLYRYWLNAANGSGVASAAAGPNEILAARQLGNVLTAPDDMTNAAWTKFDVTPTLSGTGPDSVTMSLLTEGSGSGSHRVQQAITFPGGATSGRVRYAQGIKAGGRTRARLYIFDAAGSSYVYAAINLTAGTIGAPVYSGSGVTLGAVEIERVASDVYVAMLTATVAATGCTARLYLADDTGTTVYAGDTGKGVYAWAASLAVLA